MFLPREVGNCPRDLAHPADRAHGKMIFVAGLADQLAAGVVQRAELFELARGKFRVAADALARVSRLLPPARAYE